MLVELLLLIYENDEKKKNGLGNILPSAVPSQHQQLKNLSYKAKFHYDNYCYFGSVLMI